jgi:hypothetical protein
MVDYFNKISEEVPQSIKTKFGEKINIDPPTKNERYPIFCYDYLITDRDSTFCFLHKNFTKYEYGKYFKRVKEYSGKRICDLMSEDREDYFEINSDWNNKMLDLLCKITNKGKDKWGDETLPLWGHFHLYDRKKCPPDRCPVIHFLYGGNGSFYILCYDPFHQVHKTI